MAKLKAKLKVTKRGVGKTYVKLSVRLKGKKV